MHIKSMAVYPDWLSEINGMKVSEAIKYLQTLDQNHTLDYWLEGDTHGAEIISRMCYDVPMSNAEILAIYEKKYAKEIALYEKALQEHIANNRPSRIASCEIRLQKLRDKWAEIQAKYSKEK